MRSTGAYVRSYVGLGPDLAAEVHEFVNAKLIYFGSVYTFRRAALPEVVCRGRGIADAVAPVIAIGEAASGPPEIGSAETLHVVDESSADSLDIRDLRIPPHPDAVIDHAAEMFNKVPVDMRTDCGSGFAERKFVFCIGGEGEIAGGSCTDRYRSAGFEKCASGS